MGDGGCMCTHIPTPPLLPSSEAPCAVLAVLVANQMCSRGMVSVGIAFLHFPAQIQEAREKYKLVTSGHTGE